MADSGGGGSSSEAGGSAAATTFAASAPAAADASSAGGKQRPVYDPTKAPYDPTRAATAGGPAPVEAAGAPASSAVPQRRACCLCNSNKAAYVCKPCLHFGPCAECYGESRTTCVHIHGPTTCLVLPRIGLFAGICGLVHGKALC